MTPELQNRHAEQRFKLAIEPDCSFSINSGSSTLPKSPSNRTTTPVIFRDCLTENTGSVVSCTHPGSFLFQTPVFIVDQSSSTFRKIFQQFPSVTQTSCYRRQGGNYAHITMTHPATFRLSLKYNCFRATDPTAPFISAFSPKPETNTYINLNAASRTRSPSP